MSATDRAGSLEIDCLSARWGLTEIISELSLAVSRGEIMSVFGRNGVGKTTLFKALFNIGPMTEGAVFVDGREITHHSPARIAAQGLAYVPDVGGVFGGLTVEQNLLVAARRRVRKRETREFVDNALAPFPNIEARRGQHAGSLSGGQQRMLAIARALVTRPRYVLLDEPTEGLHPSVIDSVADSMREMRDEFGAGVIWVDRRIDLALSLADRYVVMDRHTIVLRGDTRTADPDAIAARITV